MKKRHVLLASVLLTVARVGIAADMVQFLPDQIKWIPAPPGVTQNAETAILAGPLDKAIHYTYRVRLKPDGIIMPHTHPDARYTTVLSGDLYVGLTETVDESKLTRYPAGSFFITPAGQVHYSMSKGGEVTYQESGDGPTATNFLKK